MKVSTDDRCRLQSRELFKPNTRYEGERDTGGRIVLTELVPKSGPARFKSKAEALAAIEASPLRFTGSWESLRKQTR
jgi:hypothetical protein